MGHSGLSLRAARIAALILAAAGLGACGDSAPTDAGAAPPPSVSVLAVTERPFAASSEFVGRTQSFEKVDLLARVKGFLIEQDFTDGSDVDKGAILYKIDPSEYQAAVAAAEAGVDRAKAAHTEAQQTLDRTQQLFNKETVSQAELDKATAAEASAKAEVAAAEADLDTAKLNLGYTEITTPIAGRIGGSAVDVGNLIGPDSGVLATVIALDPIRVVFSLNEQTYLNVMEAVKGGTKLNLVPKIRLANGQVYGETGKLAYADNQVDQGTGTIKVYFDFPNPRQILLPGQFVNVILTSGEPENQILIPQAAVQLNQTGPFVLVVDSDSKVQIRQIQTGAIDGPNIVVTQGLTVGEQIVIDGIQKVRPGGEVTVVPAEMPADS